MTKEQFDQLVADVNMLKEVFAGPIAAYRQRQLALEREVARNKEAGAPGPNYFSNQAKRAADEARKPYLAKKQS